MAPGRDRISPETHTAYRIACLAEALSQISRVAGFLLVALLVAGSPVIYLYEYDQQNEPTPNLTPNDLWRYATLVIPGLAALLGFGFLGPWIRHKRMELTPGIAGIDKWDKCSGRDRRLLGDEHVTPRGIRHPDGAGAKPASLGGMGRILQYRSREGRRLGIVYRNEAHAVSTLRKPTRRHRKKHGSPRGIWSRMRRALGFSRKGRNRPAWWRAWLRLS